MSQSFAENALQQLAVLYQKTKEWEKAINVAEKLAKISPQENNIELAQYYCELAQSLSLEEKTQQERQKGLLVSALKVAPNCVRASILLGQTFNPRKNVTSRL